MKHDLLVRIYRIFDKRDSMINNEVLYFKSALESFSKSIEKLDHSYLNLIDMNVILKMTSVSLTEAGKTVNKAMQGIGNLEFIQDQIRDSISKFNFNLYNIALTYNHLDISELISNALTNFGISIKSENFIETDAKDKITKEDIYEIKEDIINLLKEDVSDTALQNCKEKWSEKHPIIFNIILTIVGSIIGAIATFMMESAISNATVKRDCNIYIDSNNKSQIIYNISSNSNVTIIDNTKNYYYKVLYTDTENEKDVEGYITKRNVNALK